MILHLHAYDFRARYFSCQLSLGDAFSQMPRQRHQNVCKYQNTDPKYARKGGRSRVDVGGSERENETSATGRERDRKAKRTKEQGREFTDSQQSAAVLYVAAFAVVLALLGKNGAWEDWTRQIQDAILEGAGQTYLPVITSCADPQTPEAARWMKEKALAWLPLFQYAQNHLEYETAVEDSEAIQRILKAQAPEMSMEQLRDFDYLLSNFYTVDSSTMIGADQLNVDDLLSRSMKINSRTEGPKVLIFHTHSQEEFVDSTPGDPSTSIVGIGDYLTGLLNARGIETIHDTGVYDIIDGKLDRSNAYEYAEAGIRPILEANPSIEVAIDLHRDGVSEGTHLVTEIGGRQTARIMYFNGLSRTRTNGDIDYLYNPYIQDNLSFSLQMQLASEQMYPGFARRIYLRAYRYNLHLLPKSLLIEAGAQTNTVEEMKNAMEVLADILQEVIL